MAPPKCVYPLLQQWSLLICGESCVVPRIKTKRGEDFSSRPKRHDRRTSARVVLYILYIYYNIVVIPIHLYEYLYIVLLLLLYSRIIIMYVFCRASYLSSRIESRHRFSPYIYYTVCVCIVTILPTVYYNIKLYIILLLLLLL